jgi:GNAT superfamily N-acetyltransferase
VLHPNYRNLGIEQRLLDGIEQAFRETASFEALTYGDSRNLAVYKTLGYEIDKEEKSTNGVWMVSLTKGSSYS